MAALDRDRAQARTGVAAGPHVARRASQRAREWTSAEVAPGRLVPWLAIAFGCGTIIYFAVEREPAPWGAALLLPATVAAAILCRHRPFAFPATLGRPWPPGLRPPP